MQFQFFSCGAIFFNNDPSVVYDKSFRNAKNLFQRVSLEQDKGLMVQEGE